MNIRNFCIIAHIDHGKSTLADRFLELTGTVSKRDMKAQLLDGMDLERERGITIKLTPVRMNYNFDNTDYILNLIDTPGHVDFNYEVSRSLAAVEGAILLVDCTQGVQAQTIGNLYLALEQDLKIIPVLNKIDLPNADIVKTTAEIIHLLGCKEEEILTCSGKTGEGVEELLKAVIRQVPPPECGNSDYAQSEEESLSNTSKNAINNADLNSRDKGSLTSVRDSQTTRALIFDSFYDDYKGVVASVRITDGNLKKGDKIRFMKTGAEAEVLDLGHYTPKMKSDNDLITGQIGFIVSGLKDLKDVRVGDTITLAKNPASEPLPGYKEVKPMVFAGIFPKEGDDYSALRDATDKLKLNDSALFYEPESSQALGFGFRCGFLGMLHLDIFQERLKREFGLHVIVTVPSVAYKVIKSNGQHIIVKSPQDLPEPNHIEQIEEPIMNVDIITPQEYLGSVMGLIAERKGKYLNTEYLSTGSDQRAMLHYEIPLASLITDFYDKLKTISSGYASLNYEFKRYDKTDVVKLDVIVSEERIESLAVLVWRDEAYKVGKQIVKSLRDSLPRHQFVLKIQVAIGAKVIASEKLSALRKDVAGTLSGGDVTRKNKLLEKQKKGKKKMLALGKGKVDIPTEAYLAVLKR